MAHAAGRRSHRQELASDLKARFPCCPKTKRSPSRQHWKYSFPSGGVAPGFQLRSCCSRDSHYEALSALGVVFVRDSRSGQHPGIASSDMNHYESDSITRVKDGAPLIRSWARPAWSLRLVRQATSACRLCPTVAMLIGGAEARAKNAELRRYALQAMSREIGIW